MKRHPSETASYETRAALSGPTRTASSALARGVTVHRYIILDRVGEGGMGIVYAAYDPSLDRRVALKFLRSTEADRDAVREKRMLREAQAMARLSHPNVAVVYEVGTFERQVFLAMEFVDGANLRSWLAASPRSLSDIVDIFRAAGQGLAAAHAAGIIHRDFKPDNVLVDSRDRPRVTDFGLSRASYDLEAEEPDPPADGPLTPLSAPSHLSMPLTGTDGVVGTPSYMAPEQYLGGTVDARSDQFAFCVALYEALYGQPAFEGSPTDRLRDAVAGRVSPAPAQSAVPKWCRDVLLRGLAVGPENRFASMEALLAALAPPPVSRRRWAVLVGAVGLILAGAGTYAIAVDSSAAGSGPQCDLGGQRLRGVWDQARKGRIRGAFLRTGVRGADVSWNGFAAIVDERASALAAMYDEACAATHVRGEQSPAVLDLRMECLDRRRQEMTNLLDTYSEKLDTEALDRAAASADKLSSIAACADAANLRAVVPLPSEQHAKIMVQSLRGRLNRSVSLSDAGRYDDGRQYMLSVKKEADAVGYAPVAAEAANALATHLRLGGKFREAEQVYFEAANHAVEGQDRYQEAEAWLGLLANYGQAGVVVEGRIAGRAAELAVKRASGDETLTARLASHLGAVENVAYNYDEALRHHRRAETLWKRSLGPSSPRHADALTSIGLLLLNLDRNREALTYLERALSLRRVILRPDHPDVAASVHGVGSAYMELGHLKKGRELVQRAYEMRLRALGPEHAQTIRSLQLLAGADRELGRYERAIKVLRDVVAMREKVLHPNDMHLALTYGSLAETYRRAGRLDDAEWGFNRSMELATQARPDEESAARGFALIGLGQIHMSRRLYPKARRECQRGLEILSRSYGLQNSRLAFARECVGEALAASGHFVAARRELETAVATINVQEHGPEYSANARFQLARALWPTRSARRRARELAGQSLASLERSEADNRQLIARIEAWLATHKD
jgi:eukaryotic-like serine/threonine-protein kinase